MKRLITLVRHGESEANAGLLTNLPATIALTSMGHRQSELLALTWIREPNYLIASSDLRSQHTAAPTAERCRLKVFVWDSIREFTYLEPSKWIGSTPYDRRSAVSDYWRRCDPEYVDGPGAESFKQFSRRAQHVMERLFSLENAGHVAMFTSEQFMKMFMWHMVSSQSKDAGMEEFRDLLKRWRIPNCARIEVGLNPVDG